MSLPDALEAAAGALPQHADAIRPANGDPARLLANLAEPAAAQLLGWLLTNRPGDGEELAEVWSGEAAGQAALLALDEASLPKSGRKPLRRLRHRLRSRGIATPEVAPEPTVARLPGLGDELRGAFVTPLDPMGGRSVWWFEPHPEGGARLFDVSLDDARGLLGFEVYSTSRSELRRFTKQLAAQKSFPALAVETELAQALVWRAASRMGERPAPKRWIEWRARLATGAEARLPGEVAAEALGVPDARDLEHAVKLVSEGGLGPWPPLREVLLPIVERLRTALESPLLVSGATKREQIAGQLDGAAVEAFAGDAGAVAAHRFRESAYVFWRRGDEAGARACLAAAAAFASPPAAGNPVARAFVELWLRPLLASAEGEAPASEPKSEPSLLVRP